MTSISQAQLSLFSSGVLVWAHVFDPARKKPPAHVRYVLAITFGRRAFAVLVPPVLFLRNQGGFWVFPVDRACHEVGGTTVLDVFFPRNNEKRRVIEKVNVKNFWKKYTKINKALQTEGFIIQSSKNGGYFFLQVAIAVLIFSRVPMVSSWPAEVTMSN